jgi:hypothetical protein
MAGGTARQALSASAMMDADLWIMDIGDFLMSDAGCGRSAATADFLQATRCM